MVGTRFYTKLTFVVELTLCTVGALLCHVLLYRCLKSNEIMECKLLWQQVQPNLNNVLAASFLLKFYKLIKSITSVSFC